MEIQKFNCLRRACKHSWIPRIEKSPLRCPACGSSLWKTDNSITLSDNGALTKKNKQNK